MNDHRPRLRFLGFSLPSSIPGCAFQFQLRRMRMAAAGHIARISQ